MTISPIFALLSLTAATLSQSQDFDALYKTVITKHGEVSGDLHIDMKAWMPFVNKTLRENDFSRYSSEQLLKLAAVNLFDDLPGPEDEEPRQRIVSMIEARATETHYDALLKLRISSQNPKLLQDNEQMLRLYDAVTTEAALKDFFSGNQGEIALVTLAYFVPVTIFNSRPDNARKLASGMPKKWPSDWAIISERLIDFIFTPSAIGAEKHDLIRSAAVDSINRFLEKTPTGKSAEMLLSARFRLAKEDSKLVGAVPTGLTFDWSTDPKIKKLADLKGRVVVLDFWATWCGPCIASIPQITELQKEFTKHPVTVLGVTSLQGFVQGLEDKSVNTEGNPQLEYDLTKKFMAKYKMTWPTVFTKEPVYNSSLGIGGLPFTIILGPDGKVRYWKLHPANDHQKIRRYVIDLLKEFKLSHPS